MRRTVINLIISLLILFPMLHIDNRPNFLSFSGLEDLEKIAYDFRIQHNLENSEDIDKNIAILDIDQTSIDELGPWPWRRDVIAQMIQNLRDIYRVKAIAFTEPFPDRDHRFVEVLDDLRKTFHYDRSVLSAIDRVEPDYNFDQHFLKALDGRPVFLSFKFEDKATRKISDLPEPARLATADGRQDLKRNLLRKVTTTWPNYAGYTGNDGEFLTNAFGSGFFFIPLEDDGQVRRVSLMARFAGEPYFSLAMEILRFIDNQKRAEEVHVTHVSDFNVYVGSYINKLRIDKRNIWIDPHGEMLLNFRRSPEYSEPKFKYVLAREVYDSALSRTDAEAIRDKVILVGSSSPIFNDLWNTPVSRMPGVEIYATAIANVIDHEVLQQPAHAWLAEGLILLLLAGLLSFLYPRLSPLFSLIVTVAGIVLVYHLNFNILWVEHNLVYRLVPFITLFVVLFVASNLIGFLIEKNLKRHVQGVLGQYLPVSVAKQLGEKKAGFSMEGEIREMSIMFSDVRGFTTISENLKPNELTRLMNQMLTALSQQIHSYNGTIDKYIGDAVMAFWNAPLDDKDHAANAVRGAIGMKQAMAQLSQEMEASGHPPMRIGIGINTGEACVGNMGSNIRLAYTVMGDVVNLASRLEGITKQYGIDIVVGERTRELAKNMFVFRPVDAVRVKGKTQAVTIYEPIVENTLARTEHHRLRELSLEMWQAYCERRFDDLGAILRRGLIEFPDDGLFKIYLERAEVLAHVPPSEEWEPVTTFDSK